MRFLFECLSEELPVSAQVYAYQNIEKSIVSSFKKNGLNATNCMVHATCRRLVFAANISQETSVKSVRGPAVNSGTAAIDGFKKKIGTATIYLKNYNGVEYYFADISSNESQQTIEQALKIGILDFLSSFVWPKSMFWNAHKIKWIRPIHSFICLLEDNIIEFEYAGAKSSNVTFGNRWISKELGEIYSMEIDKYGNIENVPDIASKDFNVNKKLTCASIDNYFELLTENFVILDLNKRKKHVITQFNNLKKKHKLKTKLSATNEKVFINNKSDVFDQDISLNDGSYHELIERMFYVSEYPVLFIGGVDHNFIRAWVPNKVAEVVMTTHQKYIPCYTNYPTDLITQFYMHMTHFIAVSNIITKSTIAGHEKTLDARFRDVSLIIKKDPLYVTDYSYNPGALSEAALNTHDILFSVFEKIVRILNASIVAAKSSSTFKNCKKIWLDAFLKAKTDLLFKITQEFPELQGFISAGFHYLQMLKSHQSSISNEQLTKLQIIEEHYSPISASDKLPSLLESRVLGIIDRLDTLIMLDMTGAEQSGAGDQFGLRRISTGILRLIVETEGSCPGVLPPYTVNIDVNELIRRIAADLTTEFHARSFYNFSDISWHSTVEKPKKDHSFFRFIELQKYKICTDPFSENFSVFSDYPFVKCEINRSQKQDIQNAKDLKDFVKKALNELDLPFINFRANFRKFIVDNSENSVNEFENLLSEAEKNGCASISSIPANCNDYTKILLHSSYFDLNTVPNEECCLYFDFKSQNKFHFNEIEQIHGDQSHEIEEIREKIEKTKGIITGKELNRVAIYLEVVKSSQNTAILLIKRLEALLEEKGVNRNVISAILQKIKQPRTNKYFQKKLTFNEILDTCISECKIFGVPYNKPTNTFDNKYFEGLNFKVKPTLLWWKYTVLLFHEYITDDESEKNFLHIFNIFDNEFAEESIGNFPREHYHEVNGEFIIHALTVYLIYNALCNCYDSVFYAKLNFLEAYRLAISTNDFISSEDGSFTISVYKRIHNLLMKANIEHCIQKEECDWNVLINDIPCLRGLDLQTASHLKDILEVSYDSEELMVNSFGDVFRRIYSICWVMERFMNEYKIISENEHECKRNLRILFEVKKVMDSVIDFSKFIN